MWKFLESLLSTVPREIAALLAVAIFWIVLAGGCLWITGIASSIGIPQALAAPIIWAAGIKALATIVGVAAFIIMSAGLVVMLIVRAWREPS